MFVKKKSKTKPHFLHRIAVPLKFGFEGGFFQVSFVGCRGGYPYPLAGSPEELTGLEFPRRGSGRPKNGVMLSYSVLFPIVDIHRVMMRRGGGGRNILFFTYSSFFFFFFFNRNSIFCFFFSKNNFSSFPCRLFYFEKLPNGMNNISRLSYTNLNNKLF